MLSQWKVIEMILVFITLKESFKSFWISVWMSCSLFIKFYISFWTRFNSFISFKFFLFIHYLSSRKIKRIFYFSFREELNSRSFPRHYNRVISGLIHCFVQHRSTLKKSSFTFYNFFNWWSRFIHNLLLILSNWMSLTNLKFLNLLSSISLFFRKRPCWRFTSTIQMIRFVTKLTNRQWNRKSKILLNISGYRCKCSSRLPWWSFWDYLYIYSPGCVNINSLKIKILITKFATLWEIATWVWRFFMISRLFLVRTLILHVYN